MKTENKADTEHGQSIARAEWHDWRGNVRKVPLSCFQWARPGNARTGTYVAVPGYIAVFDEEDCNGTWTPLLLPVVGQAGNGSSVAGLATGDLPVAVIHPDGHVEVLATGECFADIAEYTDDRRWDQAQAYD